MTTWIKLGIATLLICGSVYAQDNATSSAQMVMRPNSDLGQFSLNFEVFEPLEENAWTTFVIPDLETARKLFGPEGLFSPRPLAGRGEIYPFGEIIFSGGNREQIDEEKSNVTRRLERLVDPSDPENNRLNTLMVLVIGKPKVPPYEVRLLGEMTLQPGTDSKIINMRLNVDFYFNLAIEARVAEGPIYRHWQHEGNNRHQVYLFDTLDRNSMQARRPAPLEVQFSHEGGVVKLVPNNFGNIEMHQTVTERQPSSEEERIHDALISSFNMQAALRTDADSTPPEVCTLSGAEFSCGYQPNPDDD